MRKYRILAAAAFLVLCAFVGYKVAKACEYVPSCEELNTCETVEEPTCEELQNCPVEELPEEPVVPEVKKEVRNSSSVRYSQGPNGVKGDGYCQLEYHTIKGSKKIEVKYAEDNVFGNGFKSFTTEDDGAIDLKLEGNSASVKIRGRDSKTEWSDTKLVRC